MSDAFAILLLAVFVVLNVYCVVKQSMFWPLNVFSALCCAYVIIRIASRG